MKAYFIAKHGFTLVELIVVIAILVILAAILIPLVGGYIDDAEAAVCLANRHTLMRDYSVARRLNPALTPESYIATYPDALNAGLCPSSVIYTISEDSEHQLTVFCMKHSDEREYAPIGLAEIIKSIRDKWQKMTDAQKRAFNLKYMKSNNTIMPSNDAFRRAASEQVGGSWPKASTALVSASKDIAAQNGITDRYNSLYIQPYIIPQTGKTVIFAVDSSGTNWNAKMIYEPESKQWYRYIGGKTGYGLAALSSTLTYDEVMADLKDSTKFKPVNAH
ncbi:MAG: prepilin-type N-terminal cleavage/methylation domain-containing protein [Clostridia bacterium]